MNAIDLMTERNQDANIYYLSQFVLDSQDDHTLSTQGDERMSNF